MSDNIYFHIAPNTPAAAIVAKWRDSSEKHRSDVMAFLKKHDISDVLLVHRHHNVCGVAPRDNDLLGFIERHPLWRIERSPPLYAVPRRSCADSKKLAKEFDGIPRPMRVETLKSRLTGLDEFGDWFVGLCIHGIGMKTDTPAGIIVVIDYAITKKEKFAPVEGMTLGDQNALRDAWYAEDAEPEGGAA